MQKKLKIAIIGGGPAGLAAAIELEKRPFIEWKLYEKKPAISELGTGLSIQRNTWRMLELLGAADHIGADDLFRPDDQHYVQHRNSRTAELVSAHFSPADTPPHQRPCRAHRSKLQQALLKKTNQSRIRVGRKLVSTSQLESGRLRLSFEGGYTDEVDLLIGADGIRSVVREFAFPDHSISYTGSTAYRGLARTSDALKINGLEKAVIFWHGTGSKWIYTCPLGGDDLEVTVRIKEPHVDGEERVSWGQEASIRPVQDAFSGELSPPLRQLLSIVDRAQQFDFFAGPRLSSIVQHGSIALIGDASHPLSGAFGAGAGFALEDAYVLGGALEWAVEQGKPISAGLEVFDRVRSPHYEALYGVLDQYGVAEGELASLGLSPQDEIKVRIDKVWNAEHDWMYYYQADTALEQELQKLSLESSELHS